MTGRLQCRPYLRCRLLGCCVTWTTLIIVVYLLLDTGRNGGKPRYVHEIFNRTFGMGSVGPQVNMSAVVMRTKVPRMPLVTTTQEMFRDIPDELEPGQVTRNMDYCNRPVGPVTGDEADAPTGFTLKMSHIFIRHGSRSSFHSIPNQKQNPLSCIFTQEHAGEVSKLLHYIDTMKNFTGKQRPSNHFKNWSLLPDKKECPIGQLTGEGALQHLRIGQFLYEKYIVQSSMFNPGVDLGSQIVIKSTLYSRTYQSAVALLYGLLPKFNLTNLNILPAGNTIFCEPENQITALMCHCDNAGDEQQMAVKVAKSFSKQRESYLQIHKKLAETFDIESEKVPWLTAVMDAAIPQVCHSKPPVCSDFGKCMTGTMYHHLWHEIDASEAAMVRDPEQHYFKYASIKTYPVMVEIANRMKDMILGRVFQKFVLYSGHDITLSPILAMLGVFDGKWSPYASRVAIELYEVLDETQSKRMYLKFLYNGKNMTEHVVFCKGKTFHGLCKFRLFYDYVFSVCLQQFGFTSYYDACLKRRNNR